MSTYSVEISFPFPPLSRKVIPLSRFFHAIASAPKRANKTAKIKDGEGVLWYEPDLEVRVSEPDLGHVNIRVTEEHNFKGTF